MPPQRCLQQSLSAVLAHTGSCLPWASRAGRGLPPATLTPTRRTHTSSTSPARREEAQPTRGSGPPQPQACIPALDYGDGQRQQVMGRGPRNQRPRGLCSVGGARHPRSSALGECAGWQVRAMGLQGCPQTSWGPGTQASPMWGPAREQDPGPRERNSCHKDAGVSGARPPGPPKDGCLLGDQG